MGGIRAKCSTYGKTQFQGTFLADQGPVFQKIRMVKITDLLRFLKLKFQMHMYFLCKNVRRFSKSCPQFSQQNTSVNSYVISI